MYDLAVDAAVDLPRHAIDRALRRHHLDRHVGEHELDTLELADRLAELHAALCPVARQFEGADRRPQAVGRDLQPRLDEPVLGQLEPLADAAEHLVRADLDVLEQELGMAEHVGVREFRLTLDRDALERLFQQEQGRLVGIAVDIGVQDDVVGLVARGDEPFLAVDDIAVAAAVGAGLHHAHVRAGAGLRHGDTGAARAGDARHEIVADLLGRAVLEWHRGVPYDGPQRAGGLAELLVDQCLLHLGAALAADILRMVDAVEAVRHDGLAQRILGRARHGAVHFELDLVREQHCFGEHLGAALPVKVFGGQGQVHMSLPGNDECVDRDDLGATDERVDVDLGN
jgi:hypothetical protein